MRDSDWLAVLFTTVCCFIAWLIGVSMGFIWGSP